MGNPNVGKSVIFSRLTGVQVISSNYPGTTVEFTKGFMKLEEDTAEVLDIPGTYTLEPTSKAEEVAVKILSKATSLDKQKNVVINVLDATNVSMPVLRNTISALLCHGAGLQKTGYLQIALRLLSACRTIIT